MSILKMIRAQLGLSATPANNYTWRAMDDGAARLSRGNAGFETSDPLVVGSDNLLTVLASPAQFDATKKLATMEAVQQALGSYAGGVIYSANTTLTASDVGKVVFVNANSTITLPLAASLPMGAVVEIFSAAASVVVQRAGAETIGGVSGTATSVALSNNDSIKLRADPSGSWLTMGGSSVQLGSLPGFGAQKATNGYQKLPSGIIIQWGGLTLPGGGTGATVSLPIVFPNAGLQVTAVHNGGGTSNSAITAASVTTTTVYANSSYPTSLGCAYIAIGH